MIDTLPPTDCYQKPKMLKRGQFTEAKWTCSHSHYLSWKHSSSAIFRAGAWWRPVRFTSVPQWTLSSKLLHPGALLLLGGWNTKANPWMHSNQPGIPQRDVCVRISICCCQGGLPCKHMHPAHDGAVVQQFTECLHNFLTTVCSVFIRNI